MIRHILVPLDGSELAECVLPHAAALSRAFNAQITLLQVLEKDLFPGVGQGESPLDWYFRRAESEQYLETVSQRLRVLGHSIQNDIIEGQPAIGIVEYARQHHTDLILLSSHGKSGINNWRISSVVQKIISRASASIFLVRAFKPVPTSLDALHYQRVLVGLDGSQRAECVLPLASSLALKEKALLVLAHVTCKPFMLLREPLSDEDTRLVEQIVERNFQEADRYLNNLATRLSADGVNLTKQLRIGDASTSLHDLIEEENVDLVVLSAHGYTGDIHRLHGSVATNFIYYGLTPLLIVQDMSEDEIHELVIDNIDVRRKL